MPGVPGVPGPPGPNALQNISLIAHLGSYVHFSTSGGAKGIYYTISDESIKENITNTSYNATDVIKNLRFVDFDWKEDSGFDSTTRETCGVIAQEIEVLDDSFTFKPKDPVTEEEGISHIVPLKFMTVSAKAIQELITRVETLETKVAALEVGS